MALLTVLFACQAASVDEVSAPETASVAEADPLPSVEVTPAPVEVKKPGLSAAELLDLGEDEELEKPPQSTQANLPSDPQAQQVMAAYAAKSMGGSGKEVQSAVDAAKQWKPSSDALSSAQLCLDLAFGCVSASGVDVECLSSLRQCRTETPWKSETESCCHASCVNAYRRLIAEGKSESRALPEAILGSPPGSGGGCMPGIAGR